MFTDLLYPEVLDPLFTYSLARPSDDGSSFSIHPLVHVWALKRQDEKQQRTNKAQAAHLLNAYLLYCIFSFSHNHTFEFHTLAKQMFNSTTFAHIFVFSAHLSLDAIGDEDLSTISSLVNIWDLYIYYLLFSKAYLLLLSLLFRWWKHPITPFSDNLLGVTSMSIDKHELAESLLNPCWNVSRIFEHLGNNITVGLDDLRRIEKITDCLEQAIEGHLNASEEAGWLAYYRCASRDKLIN